MLYDGPRQDNKQKVQFSKSQPHIQALKVILQNPAAGPSISEGNEHHVSPTDIRLFLKAGVHKETRNRKSRVNPVLTGTAVKATLESEVKAHRKSAGHKRLFSGSKE